MKLKEYIENLQAIYEKQGDFELVYATDDEGNAFKKVYYSPTVMLFYANTLEPVDPADEDDVLDDRLRVISYVCL